MSVSFRPATSPNLTLPGTLLAPKAARQEQRHSMVSTQSPHRACFLAFANECEKQLPFYSQLARYVADDPDILRILDGIPPSISRVHTLFFAAVHSLVLHNHGSTLASYYPSIGDGTLPPPRDVFRIFCLHHANAIRHLVATRNIQASEVGRFSLFLPAMALVERELRQPLALIDLGTSAGLGLCFDRFQYDYGTKGTVGPRNARITFTCETLGALGVPIPKTMPHIVSRVGVDIKPLKLTYQEDVNWLRGFTWPEQKEMVRRFAEIIDVARMRPPNVIAGDVIDKLPELVAQAPSNSTPLVISSFLVAHMPPERRRELRQTLLQLSKQRTIACLMLDRSANLKDFAPYLERDNGMNSKLLLITASNGELHTRHLADVEPQGAWIEWTDAASAARTTPAQQQSPEPNQTGSLVS